MAYNTTFLDEDTELRAYFLGLFMADGWIDNKGGISIQLTDKQLIYDLAKALDFTNKIVKINRRYIKYGAGNWLGKEAYRLSLHKKSLLIKLQSIGFVINKTGNEFVPSCVSNITFCHFLRGLTDGDGHQIIKNINDKKYFEWGMISASKQFLDDLLIKIKDLVKIKTRTNVKSRKSTNQPVYRIRLGHNASLKLCEYMYKEATIKLDRKYDNYLIGKDIALIHWPNEENEAFDNNICPPGRTITAFQSRKSKLKHINKAEQIFSLSFDP